MRARSIAILATLDTKLGEAGYLHGAIEAHGCRAFVIDVGLDGEHYALAGACAEEVAKAAGDTLGDLRRSRRDEAMRAMGLGAGKTLLDMVRRGFLDGAIAIGGNQGTTIASFAMRMLPFGFPKLIVSTVASGNVRPYVGCTDIAMLFSVGDLLGGPNPITGRILDEAAGAIVGMAQSRRDGAEMPPSLAITAFGNTHRAVVEAMRVLGEAGWSVVPFHASGACGSAMESLIEEGRIVGVLDLTTHELLAELFPDDYYRPVHPGRMTAAGKRGIPQVVVPGGLEYFCFGPVDAIPLTWRARPTHVHNPYCTNVRTSAEELRIVARELAQRLNGSRGPVAVLIPVLGWSEVGSPGGILHDPSANGAFVDALGDHLGAHISIECMNNTINDSDFARRAAETLLGMLEHSRAGATVS